MAPALDPQHALCTHRTSMLSYGVRFAFMEMQVKQSLAVTLACANTSLGSHGNVPRATRRRKSRALDAVVTGNATTSWRVLCQELFTLAKTASKKLILLSTFGTQWRVPMAQSTPDVSPCDVKNFDTRDQCENHFRANVMKIVIGINVKF